MTDSAQTTESPNAPVAVAAPKKNLKWRIAGIVLGFLLTLMLVLMWLWSRQPGAFDVRAATEARLSAKSLRPATGATLICTMLSLNDVLLKKSGGYISNDVTPPGILMDDMPNFEFGILQQQRDLATALRNEFSRSQSQSVADANLEKAQPAFMGPNDRWIVPSTQARLNEASEQLQVYLTRLTDPTQTNAQFYARADNLEAYLRLVEKQLGSLSQRLSASVAHTRTNTDLANDPNATQSTPAPSPLFVRTPWAKIDDNFYEARGAAYALIHILKAIEVDFAPVLANKNALVSLQQIIRELEETQGSVWSPVILNGGGFGFFANHSLVMANYISRASAQIAELRLQLARG
jgi:hypothetical protein